METGQSDQWAALIDPHQPQHNFFVLPSINTTCSVNGYIGNTPVNIFGAVLSVIHYNLAIETCSLHKHLIVH